ncbi:PDZ domain-containing protein [Prevotella sp. oral taxon 317]|uniref:PDZ domain-containing protein n=1 Tax=Prevotella sp. oral taxon 317 TaxID=652721 RepID=UPI0001C3F8D5|nr:PDZ domain-containing protein [Prevotella sp. oral taxon 317]EFC68242.1 PDZ/DHR/GLGF domain protein [Prevotella sp. oral taxon 317 str. F0108]
MKRKTTLTMLFATFILMASAQKGPLDSKWESNDSIPFTWDEGIYLPATINNKYPANILFTTNANRQLVVDTTYLKEKCWQPPKIEKGLILRETDTLRLKASNTKHEVKFGNIAANFPYMLITDIRNVLGKHADGIMWDTFFEYSPFEVNFQQKFLRTLTAIPDSVKRNYRCLPLTVRDSKFMIEAYVWFNNKRIGGLYQLWLGGNDDILFTSYIVKRHNLMAYKGKTRQLLAQYTNIGDTTTTTTTFALADSVRLGLQNIGPVVVSIPMPEASSHSRMYNAGYIGAGILSSYNLVFDPAHNKLYYRPYKEHTPEKRTWGFSWINRTDIGKGWIVRSIYKGGAAEKAGIRLGDTILKVNGKKVENYSWEEERALSNDSTITLLLKTEQGMRKVTLKTEPLYE